MKEALSCYGGPFDGHVVTVEASDAVIAFPLLPGRGRIYGPGELIAVDLGSAFYRVATTPERGRHYVFDPAAGVP